VSKLGGVVPQCGLFFADMGLRSLRSLHGAEAGRGQMGVPLKILLRKDKCGLIRNDLLISARPVNALPVLSLDEAEA
jgi:hypothetical protein